MKRWISRGVFVLALLALLPIVFVIVFGLWNDRDLASLAAGFLYERPTFTVGPDSLERAPYEDAVYVGNLLHTDIGEASGLAPSRRRDDLLWTLNDSGNEPMLYALGLRGEDLGQVSLPVANIDWEDLASFLWKGRAYLAVADVGDNLAWRKSVFVYVLEEPVVPDSGFAEDARAPLAWQVELRFEDGPRDCEAIAIDPSDLTLLLLSKREVPSKLYSVSLTNGGDSAPVRVARPIAELFHIPQPTAADLEEDPDYGEFRSMTTALDLSPDGRRALVLTYKHAYEFERRDRESWRVAFSRAPRFVPLPPMDIAEAASYDRSGDAFYVTSEHRPAPLFRVARRPEAVAAPASAAASSARAAAAAR